MDIPSVPKSFFDMQRECQDFINQGALAHRTASSQEEWELLWNEVLKANGLQNDTDMQSLVYTDAEDQERQPLKVIH